MRYFALTTALVLAACSQPETAEPDQTGPALFTRLSALCGQAFEGRVVSEDERDADWAAQVLTMHVRTCTDDEIRIPLHVGEDRSRTWVISLHEEELPDGSEFRFGDDSVLTCSDNCRYRWLRLKHDHRHEDGSEDVLTQYGGDSMLADLDALTAGFHADEFSRALFEREGIPASMENVWTLTLSEDSFSYALDRPNRHFQAVFDLTQPVPAPPPPWGSE